MLECYTVGTETAQSALPYFMLTVVSITIPLLHKLFIILGSFKSDSVHYAYLSSWCRIYCDVWEFFGLYRSLSHSVCLNHGSWSQGRVGRSIFGSSLLSSERNIHETSKRGNTRRCPTPNAYPLSLLSWRCLQWERPNALLEERERFIKDWRDCALSVFYWRLPAFLWACLLQQHWYVRQESGDTLRCIHFENSQSAPDPYCFSK